MNRIKNNKKGFTLIEVVLVLAIGGLIFLLAFIAFQQVSANRRDTQRRSDANRVIAELQNYKGDNTTFPVGPTNASPGVAAGGAVTGADAKSFIDSYLSGASFVTPDKVPYTIITTAGGAGVVLAKDQMSWKVGYQCNPAGTGMTLIAPATTGRVAVLVGLEKGTACRDDQ